MQGRIIANDGYNDFIGNVMYVEEGYVYFEVEHDIYHCPVGKVTLIGHMEDKDYYRAETYSD